MKTNTTSDNSSPLRRELDKVMEKYADDLDGKAKLLSELLADPQGIRHYRLLLQHNSASMLFELAHDIKLRGEQGKIKTSRAIYFVSVLKHKKIQTKFRKDEHG